MPPKKKAKTTTAKRDEAPVLRSFIVTYDISGRATAEVMAATLDDARQRAKNLNIVDGTDQLIEWNLEDVKHIEEND